MRQVVLPATNIAASALGFGCQPILARIDGGTARRALDQAFDLGIRHFDLARSYGLGEAEAVIGRFARGRRDRVTIETKFGILPAKAASRYAALKPIARVVLNRLPALRSRIRAQMGPLTVGGNFAPAAVRESVEASLRALGTDYIDILVMHDCRRDVSIRRPCRRLPMS